MSLVHALTIRRTTNNYDEIQPKAMKLLFSIIVIALTTFNLIPMIEAGMCSLRDGGAGTEQL